MNAIGRTVSIVAVIIGVLLILAFIGYVEYLIWTWEPVRGRAKAARLVWLFAWPFVGPLITFGPIAYFLEQPATGRPARETVWRGSAAPRRLIVLIPLIAFLALAALFMYRLGSGDPSRIPSALIGKPVPQTVLPPVPGLERDGKPVPGLDSASFKGEVTVLNVWASWCVPCHEEAPLLLRLATDKRIHLVGMNQKDNADNARRFLGRYGNPFAANGVDRNGRASIEWGVYGVPETFVIGRDGRITYKLIGAITPDNLEKVLKPQIEKALTAEPSP